MEDWLEKKGVKEVGHWEARELGYKTSLCPDLLVKPKFSKKRVIAIEVKGSSFAMKELIGQLLMYRLCFSFVYAAIPSERERDLRKLRSTIRRRMKGFNFGIISVSADGNIKVSGLKMKRWTA